MKMKRREFFYFLFFIFSLDFPPGPQAGTHKDTFSIFALSIKRKSVIDEKQVFQELGDVSFFFRIEEQQERGNKKEI